MIVSCFSCEVEFNKTPSEIRRSKSGNHFCSRSCSAKHNNKGGRRNSCVPRQCKRCEASYITSGGHRSRNLCPPCLAVEKSRSTQTKLRTMGEERTKASVQGKHPSWVHSNVRNLCRSWNKHRPRVCEECGYTAHVEMCHIKAIGDFPDEATLGEVNAEENVRILCPNHHWEFDNLESTASEI